jgi:hypothetical protein
MKVISKFQDYYDIGLAYGVDEKLRFKRETSQIELGRNYSTHVGYIYYEDARYYRLRLFTHKLYFCGQCYPIIRAATEKIVKEGAETSYYVESEQYLYDLATYERFISQLVGQEREMIVGTYSYSGYSEKRQRMRSRDFMDAKEFFEEGKCRYMHIFEEKQVPYFVVEYRYLFENQIPCIEHEIVLLPQLKAYKFATVMPPMQAFQEISMYLGQLGLAEDNTVTIEDKYLAQGKGFDCYSFRKMPTKKRAKKC